MSAAQSTKPRKLPLIGIIALVLLSGVTLTPAQDTEAGSLAGHVVDEGSGKPLQGATVTLTYYFSVRPKTVRTENTANDGSFTFASIPPGEYRATVSKDHYLSQEYGQRAPGWESKLITVPPGKRVNAIKFQLGKKGAISGTVVDHNGSAVPDAKMLLYTRSSAPDGNWDLNSVAITGYSSGTSYRESIVVKTDLLGRYQFVDLEPNDYFVVATRQAIPFSGGIGPALLTMFGPGSTGGHPCSASAPGPRLAAAFLAIGGNLPVNSVPASAPPRGELELPTLYPGTHEPAKATTVHVSANADIQSIDFNLRSIPTAKLTGTVTLPEDYEKLSGGTPFCANVALTPIGPGVEFLGSEGNKPLVTLQESRTFQFDAIVPGTYKVVAVSESFGRPMVANQNVELKPGGSQMVTLALKPTFDVTGKMVADSSTSQGFSLDGIKVVLTQKSDPAVASLMYLSGLSDSSTISTVSTDGAFVFVLHGVLPEVTYSLGFSGLQQAYLTSMRYGGSEFPSRETPGWGTITVKKEPEELTLHFDHILGRIEAVVMGDQGKPLAGVSTVLSQRGQIDLISTPHKLSDDQGRVVFENVVPGDYEIYAWEVVTYQRWYDRSFMEQFRGRAQPVHVEKGGVTNVNVQTIMLERAN